MADFSLVLDLSASLYMGLVDASGATVSFRIRENVRGESAHALLDEMLAEAGTGPAGIAELGIGIGPGSFTGIRVGVALAQGLAFAGRLPLYPFSSLAAMLACAPAGSASDSAGDLAPRVAAIAANGGRYYAARGRPAVESLITGAELESLGGNRAMLVTSGPVPDRDRLAAAFGTLVRLEEAMDFGKVMRLAKKGPPVTDGVIRPNYLMASAAEEKRRAAEA